MGGEVREFPLSKDFFFLHSVFENREGDQEGDLLKNKIQKKNKRKIK